MLFLALLASGQITERSTAGRRWPRNRPISRQISQLTSRPEPIPSPRRRTRHNQFQHRSRRHLYRSVNALAETINGLYKAEVIPRRGPWRSCEAVEFATLEWVDWFNHRRLMEPIGNIPPAEAEERYYAMLALPAMAA